MMLFIFIYKLLQHYSLCNPVDWEQSRRIVPGSKF